ncbi:DNA topoisomerase IB [Nocardia nova]|uniref:DNA topoisomerase IB n=1 Tax=Nocardia nova TaxID=37330 RepID=A0A2S6A2T6_9NOCA|nr:DNA topoisomerase IB [Nocardia nova]PPJ25963.1 DNA topoisomerase IB [Nocardia nova]
MRLRRSTPYGAGIGRVRRGKGFAYVDENGFAVTDPEATQRIDDLVIPPAWRKVWICPHAHGHIQAVGVDAAGRRQYLYHEQWRRGCDEEKFDRMLEVAAQLPSLREQVGADLRRSGLDRRRVEAVVIGLLDRGVFRIGSEEYAEENGTRGVATLLHEQVRVSGKEMRFDYVAKGGIRRRLGGHRMPEFAASSQQRRAAGDDRGGRGIGQHPGAEKFAGERRGTPRP